MAYEVEIRDVEAQPVLAVRGDRVASSEIALFMAESYRKIGRHAAAHGLAPSGKPMARYHNIEGDWFDLEALIPFTAPGDGEADVYASSLDAGRAATCEHVGPTISWAGRTPPSANGSNGKDCGQRAPAGRNM